MTRCVDTAALIAARQALAVTTTRLLRERKFGRFEGKTADYCRRKLKKELDYFETLTDDEKFCHKVHPEVESTEEVVGRFLTFARQVAVSHLGKTILLVSHGGMMRGLLLHLGFASYHELGPGSVGNTAWFKLLSDGIEFWVKESSGLGLARVS